MQVIKMSAVTLYKCNLVKIFPHKEEIFYFILYNRALGNAVTSNKIIYKLRSID